MRGIVIAAGRGVRMRPLTEDQPKCLLPIAGRTLLDWTIDALRAAGCKEIVVITGHAADAIERDDILRVANTDYENNNILHSLMYARDFLEGPVLVSYSDIWVEPWIHKALAESSGDVVLAVDDEWQPYYDGRTEHPLSEAENIFFSTNSGQVSHAGKHLHPDDAGGQACGEFLGLWKMSAAGTRVFKNAFDAVNDSADPLAPFQHAPEWRKSYITDLIQQLIDTGNAVDACVIQRGWAELDTQQDYDRLLGIASRQRLDTLVAATTPAEEVR